MATESSAVTATKPLPTSLTLAEAEKRVQTASTCAMNLMPEAQSIFEAVSPKVELDSNLKKLVKKNVRPKVFSGKLSIKSARKNAQAASACLRILKHGSAEPR